MDDFYPLKEYGNLTAVKRTVLNFIQKGFDEIIVIVGEHGQEVEIECSKMDVIFYHDEDYRENTYLESALKAGEYFSLDEKDIIYTTVKTPFFWGATLKKLMKADPGIYVTCYEGEKGNVFRFPSRILPKLRETGQKTVEEALDFLPEGYEKFPVKDPGTVYIPDRKAPSFLGEHNRQLLRTGVKVSIARENKFFGPGVRRLLRLIDSDGSVKNACQSMGMSYSKAWKMINIMEEELGFEVIVRRAGGSAGGESYLTPEGKIFLEKYEYYEDTIGEEAKKLFRKLFSDY